MVGVIRSGIILEDVDRIVPDTSNRAPIQVAENHHQVGPDPVAAMVQFFRAVDTRANWLPVLVAKRLKLSDQLVTQRLILTRFDDPLRFTTLHIEKHASIIAALAPDLRLAPIHFALRKEFTKGFGLLWILVNGEVFFPNEPLV